MPKNNTDRPVLLVAGNPPDDWFERLEAVADQVEIRRGSSEEETQDLSPDADCAFAWSPGLIESPVMNAPRPNPRSGQAPSFQRPPNPVSQALLTI